MRLIFIEQRQPSNAEAEKGAQVVFIYKDTDNDQEHTIFGCKCHESWEQWGAVNEVLSANCERIEKWRAEQPEEEEEEEEEDGKLENITVLYDIDWDNVDLEDSYFKEQKILDPISFADLLLTINCNISHPTPENVRRQFNELLQANIEEAKEIFESNLINITNYSKK